MRIYLKGVNMNKPLPSPLWLISVVVLFVLLIVFTPQREEPTVVAGVDCLETPVDQLSVTQLRICLDIVRFGDDDAKI